MCCCSLLSALSLHLEFLFRETNFRTREVFLSLGVSGTQNKLFRDTTKVMPVPFWEWDALRDEEAKRWYLEDKLRGG